MRPISYGRATDEAGAIASVVRHRSAVFLAGGTNLLDMMKELVMQPEVLVDITRLPLDAIEETPNGVRIGAMARNSAVAYHPLIQERYPVLSEALLSGATPQLRNMATVGGNLMQRTRCPYFRDPVFACNKREPGVGCAALRGHHRNHAIMGTSDACIATHPSDMAVAMTALDATLCLRSPKGERRVALTDFYLTPRETPNLETQLEEGELITAVEVPVLPFARRSTYLKVRDRASFEFAVSSVAVAIEVKGGTIASVRLALGGVATKPWRAFEAERTLLGQAPTMANFERAADAELKAATPLRDNAYKVPLAKRSLVRALETVCNAPGGTP